MKSPFVRGPQGRAKLSPEDSARLSTWTQKYGFDGAAKRLGVSPMLIHKLSYEGTASPQSVKHMSDVLRVAEQLAAKPVPQDAGSLFPGGDKT